MVSMKLLIPVASGLEQITKRQLFALGYERAPADNGRIEIEGDWQDIARLNVLLRSGERVLIVLDKFHATTFDELYEGVYNIPWENWLDVDSQILMDGKSVQSQLAAIKVSGGVAKKAIIRRLSDKLRSGRKTFSETGARSIVGVSAYKDEVTITLDTSGEGLHKRGYRSLAYSAPLKETLAAALIDSTFYNPDRDEEKPFADIFLRQRYVAYRGGNERAAYRPWVTPRFRFCFVVVRPERYFRPCQTRGKGPGKTGSKIANFRLGYQP